MTLRTFKIAALAALITTFFQSFSALAADPAFFIHYDSNTFPFLRPLPKADVSEIEDAFAQFVDPAAALAHLKELRVKNEALNGKVFAGFTEKQKLTGPGDLTLLCGISASASSDWEEVRGGFTEIKSVEGGKFTDVRYSSRPERIRAIARCFAQMSGMPALKSIPRIAVKKVLIDKGAFEMATRYLKKSDPKGYTGAQAQYDEAFKCLITAAAQEMPDAQGDTAVVQTNDSGIVFSVVGAVAADAIWGHPKNSYGLWPSAVGFDQDGFTYDGNAAGIEQILRRAKRLVPDCRRKAGLFELPPTKVEIPSNATDCQQDAPR